MRAIVVTGYVPISGHPRGADEYDRLATGLVRIHAAPVRPFRGELADCWLHRALHGEAGVRHAVGDDPDKNTLAYHVVQHQKTAWLCQAAETEPRAGVLVWIDYGVLHQPGVTALVLDEFLRRVESRDRLLEIAIPGAWARSRSFPGLDGDAMWPDWRFLGSSLVVARDLAHDLHRVVREVTLHRLATDRLVTWEVNDWAVAENRRELPIRWYEADHDHTQFTRYR